MAPWIPIQMIPTDPTMKMLQINTSLGIKKDKSEWNFILIHRGGLFPFANPNEDHLNCFNHYLHWRQLWSLSFTKPNRNVKKQTKKKHIMYVSFIEHWIVFDDYKYVLAFPKVQIVRWCYYKTPCGLGFRCTYNVTFHPKLGDIFNAG